MFAILDVETTGLNPAGERITEIAIYLHDGLRITGEFQTLVNPEKSIPFQITSLTGINNRMVADAPRFCDVAREIVELTADRIIVGHNVAFDYRFIRAEFKRLFYDFKRKTLCTKQLSRKLLPGRKSYGLGNLSRELGITNEARHRAGGDALATVKLFEHLRSIEDNLLQLSLKGLNSNLDRKIIDSLPEATGVYYFLDGEGKIIYIGKSLNIRDRILSHLSNNNTKRAMEMRERVANIDWELTGSELIALLLESDEIKKHKPIYNRQQRRTLFQYGLFCSTDIYGYKWLKIKRINGDESPLTSYTNHKEALAHIQHLVDEYELCQKLCGLYPSTGACFYHQISKCHGACTGKEQAGDYNRRVEDALERYLYHDNNFYLIDQGRGEGEVAVVKVCNGAYKGFGYLGSEDADDRELLDDCIRAYADNKDVQVIIKGFMRKYPEIKVLSFEH